MSSEDVVLKMENVSKRYEIYSSPADRLKQMFLDRFGNTYYKEFWALRDINFSVKRGESIGVIGRNGAGKSTLLQILVGTLACTTGKVYTHGRIAALLELRSGFNPEFSGRENVFMNASLLGLSRKMIEERYDDILAFADIGDFINYPVKKYSSGMMVRLAFAVQIMVDPDIMIVDEALAVGDAAFQRKCYAKLEERLNAGMTLFLVTHSTGVIKQYCNRVLYLKNGACVFNGSPIEGERLYFSDLFPKSVAKDGAVTSGKDKGESTSSMKKKGEEHFREYVYDVEIPHTKMSYGVSFGTINRLRVFGLIKPNILPIKGCVKIQVECSWHEEMARELVDEKGLEPNIVVGYCISNQKNISVFGVNTLTEGVRINPFVQNHTCVTFDINLPEMQNGVYFLTVAMQLGNLDAQVSIGWYDFVVQFVVQNQHRFGGTINPETHVCIS